MLARDDILLRVWERGTGATKACGSAACATLVAAARAGLGDRAARLRLPGGDLNIEWRADDHVLMTGPVEFEFETTLDPQIFQERRRVNAPLRNAEVVTFGCRLNAVELQALAKAHASARETVVVNTCAVTGEATRQARQTIRRLHRERPQAEIVVAGCAALGSIRTGFAEIDGVTQVLAEHAPNRALASVEGTRGLLAVQNGCDHRCTFCIIPFGRGAGALGAAERSPRAGARARRERQEGDRAHRRRSHELRRRSWRGLDARTPRAPAAARTSTARTATSVVRRLHRSRRRSCRRFCRQTRGFVRIFICRCSPATI